MPILFILQNRAGDKVAKCRICKVELKLNNDDFVRLNQRFYYHTSCYKERELDKGIPIDIIDEVICSSKKQYKDDHKKKIKKYKDNNIRDGIEELTNWIQLAYDISFLPKTFYLRMASVANGTYKGLKEPITYKDLLDMLQRRKKQLDIKLANKKFNSELNRFYYDLAIVLSQYDSYLKWKTVQEIKKQEAMESLELQKRQKESSSLAKKTRKQDDSLEDVLDEIFE